MGLHPQRVLALPEYHARVAEGVNPFKTVDIHDLPRDIFPSGQPCLEGKRSFGDPFEDSGVVELGAS